MRTRHNIQKTVLEQVKKSTLYGIAVLFCTTSIFQTVTAGNLKCQTELNSNKFMLTPNLIGTEAIQTDVAFDFLEYRAQKFVDAELVSESEYSLNNYDEFNQTAIETELTLHVESYCANNFAENEFEAETQNYMYNSNETISAVINLQIESYNANDFTEAELTEETKCYMNSNSDAIEAELTLQIDSYNANDFAEAELAAETEHFMNSNNDSFEIELNFQLEKYNAQYFADTEMDFEIENWMIQDGTLASDNFAQK